MSGFHGNTNSLTAAVQGLFSSAGGSLTPVCQGGMIEGENDPAHTGMQLCFFLLLLFLFFSCQKVLIAWAFLFISLSGSQLKEHFRIIIRDAMSVLNITCSYSMGGKKCHCQICPKSAEKIYIFCLQPHFLTVHGIIINSTSIDLTPSSYTPLAEHNCSSDFSFSGKFATTVMLALWKKTKKSQLV